MSEKKIRILLVEDEEADIELVTDAFKSAKFNSEIAVARDGDAAIAYVKKQGEFRSCETPDLILLDLNLPKKNGHQVLNELKADPNYGMIPIVIMSSSDAEADIVKCYQSHVNCYVQKPADLFEIEEIVGAIQHFWFSIVTRPPVRI